MLIFPMTHICQYIYLFFHILHATLVLCNTKWSILLWYIFVSLPNTEWSIFLWYIFVSLPDTEWSILLWYIFVSLPNTEWSFFLWYIFVSLPDTEWPILLWYIYASCNTRITHVDPLICQTLNGWHLLNSWKGYIRNKCHIGNAHDLLSTVLTISRSQPTY